jgi:hypothetical protein
MRTYERNEVLIDACVVPGRMTLPAIDATMTF